MLGESFALKFKCLGVCLHKQSRNSIVLIAKSRSRNEIKMNRFLEAKKRMQTELGRKMISATGFKPVNDVIKVRGVVLESCSHFIHF